MLTIVAVVLSFSAELVFADSFRCPNGNIVSIQSSLHFHHFTTGGGTYEN